jgi:hypothetical protein
MTQEQKTSTFTIFHDRCDPSRWTIGDFKALADFARTGELAYAARLSRLGMQLVLSDHHEATGGTIEEIGWSEPKDNSIGDLDELVDDDLVMVEVTRIYRGPSEFAVRIGVGDEDGEREGSEYEVFKTEHEAQEFITIFMVDVSKEQRDCCLSDAEQLPL